MGKYINKIGSTLLGTSFVEKCLTLESKGAVKVTDKEFLPNMICVVDNGHFAAAGYAFDKREFEVFKRPDERPKAWYTLDNVAKYID